MTCFHTPWVFVRVRFLLMEGLPKSDLLRTCLMNAKVISTSLRCLQDNLLHWRDIDFEIEKCRDDRSLLKEDEKDSN